jgi:DNA (cytosine-5)-methyltransferase 1
VQTIRRNRPDWVVATAAPTSLIAQPLEGVDLISATIRELPEGRDGQPVDPLADVLSVIEGADPAAILISVSPEMSAPRFAVYRERIVRQLDMWGFRAGWQQFDLSWFGIPQRRRVFVLVAGDPARIGGFAWPARVSGEVSMGRFLYPQMVENGWAGALFWASRSSGVGPPIRPDVDQDEMNLGSALVKAEWRTLAIDAYSIAAEAPAAGSSLEQNPRLTLAMIAHLQGFHRDWQFFGTPAEQLRQIAGEFPALIAESLGRSIAASLRASAVIRADFTADRSSETTGSQATA